MGGSRGLREGLQLYPRRGGSWSRGRLWRGGSRRQVCWCCRAWRAAGRGRAAEAMTPRVGIPHSSQRAGPPRAGFPQRPQSWPAGPPNPAIRRMQGWRGQLPERPPGDEAGPPQEGRGLGPPRLLGAWLLLACLGRACAPRRGSSLERPGAWWGPAWVMRGRGGAGGLHGSGSGEKPPARPQITPWRAGGQVGMDAPLPWVPCQPTLG